MIPCSLSARKGPNNYNDTEKKNIGNLPALYPKPMTITGAEVEGEVNWLVVGHTGIIGHDRIIASMSKKHHTDQGVGKSKKLSINLVSPGMLPQADYVGSVSGTAVDKSDVSAHHAVENGTPVIDASPLTMECNAADIYETEGFDSFLCSVVNTYEESRLPSSARKPPGANSILPIMSGEKTEVKPSRSTPEVLDNDGKLDYTRLKPVLFEFPSYSYLATGEIIGKRLNLEKQLSVCAKHPMQADGIVRLSRIDAYPQYIDEYIKYAAKAGEISLRTEPGVLTMYAVGEKENPCRTTILETYASRKAYEEHIVSEHFRKYEQETRHMVNSLVLSGQTPANPASKIKNFIQ